MFGDAMSIFARRVFAPSGNSPFLILSKSDRFSSMLLFLYGLPVPGSVSVPRVSRIWSAFRSHTNAFPFPIRSTAHACICGK